MFFVPVVPPTPQAPLSHRTRELGDLLGRVIEEYERHHPSVTGQEVRQALQLASRHSKAAGSGAVQVLLAGVAAALVLAGVMAFLVLERGGGTPESFPLIAVAVGIFSVLVVAILLKRLSGG